MFLLGVAVGTIIGMALGIALVLIEFKKVWDNEDEKYKCEIEEVWIDEG